MWETVLVPYHGLQLKLEYKKTKKYVLYSVSAKGEYRNTWSVDIKDWLEDIAPLALKEIEGLGKIGLEIV